MLQTNKLKIFNDPIYGFITIPNTLIFDIIEHPYFQRLRRISQMGLSSIVYPGAHHTRFHHALGCMHLMQKAIQVLRFKGVAISDSEKQSLLLAILLHDLGHGPFSHALEGFFLKGVSHEALSLSYMKDLNAKFNNSLTEAIAIFSNEHPKKYFNQLISGQLDMDRLDYLKRDSFYTGVVEGSINSDRLISMLHVKNNELVVEEKGIYSVEQFLLSRRFMYWQVYFHKTGLLAEKLLLRVLERARILLQSGVPLFVRDNLKYFLENSEPIQRLMPRIIQVFTTLDDYDVMVAIKEWQSHDDFVLSELAKMLIGRRLPKIMLSDSKFNLAEIQKIKDKVLSLKGINQTNIDYFIFQGKMQNKTYSTEHGGIKILLKNGDVKEWSQVDSQFASNSFTTSGVKYYLAYPKEISDFTP